MPRRKQGKTWEEAAADGSFRESLKTASASFAPVTDSETSAVYPVTFPDPRRLLTFDLDHSVWTSATPTFEVHAIDLKGAIVRIRAPHTATDEQVERVRRLCEEDGAARVVVLPRQRAQVLPERVAEQSKTRAWTPRAAVESLVKESNSNDGAALAALCERIMSEVGL